METEKSHGAWYRGIAAQIDLLKETLSEKNYKKYRLDMLLCVAERVEEFSPECGLCQLFQEDINALVQDINNVIQLDDTNRRKAHLKMLNSIIKHLQKEHKLITEGYYMGVWMALGSGIGVALGAVMDQAGGGIPIGIGIGVSIGAGLDAKAKKEGRVLCPRKSGAGSRNTKVIILVILGILMLAGLVAFLVMRRS
ncbi:hypothetical protein ACFLUG_03585 [Chloroflexota bacterium]